jgi:hypothetical protein
MSEITREQHSTANSEKAHSVEKPDVVSLLSNVASAMSGHSLEELATDSAKDAKELLDDHRDEVKELITYAHRYIHESDLSLNMQNCGAYVGSGYDIYFGFPYANGVDPGYRGQVLDLTKYEEGKRTSDQRLLIPDGAEVKRCDACSSSFSSSLITGMSSLKKDLDVSVSVSGSYGGGAFSASVDYQKAESSLSKSREVIVESKAECCAYTVTTTDPKVVKNFAKALESLTGFSGMELDEQKSVLLELFKEFGTHVVLSVKMGGRFGRRKFVKADSLASSKKSKLEIEAEASYDGLMWSASAKAGMSLSEKEESKSSKSSERKEMFSVGGIYDPDKNQWMKNVIDEPMPIAILHAVPLHKVISPEYMPSVEKEQVQEWSKAVSYGFSKYCEWLQGAGKLVGCIDPESDEFSDLLSTTSSDEPVENFAGIYFDNEGCDKQGEFFNPMTGSKSCDGTSSTRHMAVHASNKLTRGGCSVDVFYCTTINDAGEFAEKQPFFGGMLSIQHVNKEPLVAKNPYTQNYRCPSGYDVHKVATMVSIPGHGVHKKGVAHHPRMVATVYACFLADATPEPTQNLLGGFYQLDSNKRVVHKNPFASDKTHCPTGYKAHGWGENLDGSGPAYVCLSETLLKE